jgi:putative FmdB family regulatory protein
MPLYDYGCKECDNVIEVFHKMDEQYRSMCVECKSPMQKLLSDGYVKRPDSPWIEECANGAMNDLTRVREGKEENITTREQARAQINRLYAEPYRRPKNDSEVAANKRVGLLRQRYLERY